MDDIDPALRDARNALQTYQQQPSTPQYGVSPQQHTPQSGMSGDGGIGEIGRPLVSPDRDDDGGDVKRSRACEGMQYWGTKIIVS